MAVQVSFRAHLEGTEQSGLLSYVGDTRQHISLTLGKYSNILSYYRALDLREKYFCPFHVYVSSHQPQESL